jgi:predicted ATPase/DNA-binding CsgD family transcriptional regulator
MSRAMYAVPRDRTPVPVLTVGSFPKCILPAQPTSLVGRESLSNTACDKLRDPGVRWLTMSGPPGVGKTRLALRVASLLPGFFAGGVYFAALSAINESDLVLSSIAQSLSVKEARHRALLDQLKRHLRDKDLLLVLDNFEQVTGAAIAVCELLSDCPGLKVLATSRTLLHVYGEHDFPVPPLSVPTEVLDTDPEALLQAESVALFVQRAQAARPDFALTKANSDAVAQICAHLEGLPLAIELAAARVRVLPPNSILPRVAQRLQFLNGGAMNLPARQRTLRGAVEWSYDLLEDEEQTLFRSMAVFVGGASMEAIERILDLEDVSVTEVEIRNLNTRKQVSEIQNPLDTLASLIDKSLLRQVDGVEGEPRYVMLETVREYALERLVEREEGERIRQRHAVYYTEFAEQTRAELPGPRQKMLLDRLEQEHDNFSAALEWLSASAECGVRSAEHPEAASREEQSKASSKIGTMALRLATALHPFWEMRGYMTEGRTRLRAALRGAGTGADSEARAHALYSAGRIALIQGDDEAAEELTLESLELHRSLRHKLGMSCALVSLGHLAIRHGDSVKASEMYQEAFILRTEIADPLWVARSLASLGYLSHFLGDYDRAVELHEQGLVLCREAGDKSAIGGALIYLSHEVAGLGHYARMHNLLGEAIGLFQEIGSSHGIGDCLAIYGKAAYAQSRWEWATVLFGLAKSLLDAIGLPMEPPSNTDLSEYEQDVEELKERLGVEAFSALWSSARQMTPEEAIAYGWDAEPVAVPVVAPALPSFSEAQSRPQATYPAGLTPREVEVLRLVASGLTNIEAADKLTVSRHTINMHLRSIYSKLAVTSRLAATRIAIAEGIV